MTSHAGKQMIKKNLFLLNDKSYYDRKMIIYKRVASSLFQHR